MTEQQTILPLLEQHTAKLRRKNRDGYELFPIGDIDRGQAQLRFETDQATVEQYAEHYQAGEAMPPVVIFHEATLAGDVYHLADGFHRVAAAELAEQEEIEAIIKQGGLRDAIWYAARANAQHGLSLTIADKRSVVDHILADAEWSAMSDRAIAEHIGCVSHTFVSKRRSLKEDRERPADQGEQQVLESTAGGEPASEEVLPADTDLDDATDGDEDLFTERDEHVAPASPEYAEECGPAPTPAAKPANPDTKLRFLLAGELLRCGEGQVRIGYTEAMALALIMGLDQPDDQKDWHSLTAERDSIDVAFYEQVSKNLADSLSATWAADIRKRLPTTETICDLYHIDHQRLLELSRT